MIIDERASIFERSGQDREKSAEQEECSDQREWNERTSVSDTACFSSVLVALTAKLVRFSAIRSSGCDWEKARKRGEEGADWRVDS